MQTAQPVPLPRRTADAVFPLCGDGGQQEHGSFDPDRDIAVSPRGETAMSGIRSHGVAAPRGDTTVAGRPVRFFFEPPLRRAARTAP